ncbi:MAG: DUF5683 domain-containing protein [Bacteroidales bacterium]|jgi:hypothetical protein|nr:DUF5683 domain-containing protein [Bacteroidales bacterium]
MKQFVPLFLFFSFLLLANYSYSQEDTTALLVESAEELDEMSDSLELELIRKHNPTKAALWAIVPGGGQIYNKKWWKLPIVYTLLGTSGYLIYYFADETIKYRNEYFFRQYGAVEYYNPELSDEKTENILFSRNANRQYMDIAIGAFAICYALSIIDAVVDAHLFYFNISDDLSMQISPSLQNNLFSYNKGLHQTFSTGLTLRFSF